MTYAPYVATCALAMLLLGGCTDNGTAGDRTGLTQGSATPGAPTAGATAPNANNPYPADPQDPNMNPHYMHYPH
jgi:hypothetical protein